VSFRVGAQTELIHTELLECQQFGIAQMTIKSSMRWSVSIALTISLCSCIGIVVGQDQKNEETRKLIVAAVNGRIAELQQMIDNGAM
jgi:hypothetical protein